MPNFSRSRIFSGFFRFNHRRFDSFRKTCFFSDWTNSNGNKRTRSDFLIGSQFINHMKFHQFQWVGIFRFQNAINAFYLIQYVSQNTWKLAIFLHDLIFFFFFEKSLKNKINSIISAKAMQKYFDELLRKNTFRLSSLRLGNDFANGKK